MTGAATSTTRRWWLRAWGSDIRTYSLFANDQWRYNARLSFNIGFRFDLNRSKDQGGVPVLKDSQWSPRLGVSWDVAGNGKWIANAGFARYVMGVNGAVVDSGSQGGRTASYSWTYTGPKINTTCTAPNCQTIAQVLPQVFAWFNGNGGVNNTTYRSAPSIPGVTTHVSDKTTAPSSTEVTVGMARELGQGGTVRVDYVYRNYKDIYGSYIDTTTGKVTDSTGRTYDADLIKNTPDARRWYHAVTAAANYRLKRVILGGNYTLSYSKGNNDGENVGSGPVMSSINEFPEYRRESWSWPEGYMGNDQRHKVRLYATYLVPVSPVVGSLTIGLVERVNTGTPYDIAFSVNPTGYITNPGYLAPPTSMTYYINGRGPLRMDTINNTDLSVVWSKKLHGSLEVFFRGLAYNLFNAQGVEAIDTTVNSNASPGAYTAASLPKFDPYTATPVEGTNYRYASTFGLPSSPSDYQTSRTFSFSFGIRF